MNRNIFLAFILSMLVVTLWMLFVQKNYETKIEKGAPIFYGIKKYYYNEEKGTLRLEWEPAKANSPVTYLIFLSQTNKITDFSNPDYYTKTNFIEINDIDFNTPHYITAVAKDSYNNVSTNIKFVYIKPSKSNSIIKKYESLTNIKIETKNAIYYFSPFGARLKQIILKNYKNITDRSNVKLIISKNPLKFLPLDFLIIENDGDIKKDEMNYYELISKNGTNIIFKAKTKDFEIRKSYYFKNSGYDFNLNISLKYSGDRRKIENYKDKEVMLKLQPYLGPVDEKSRYNILNLGYFLKNSLSEIHFSAPGGCIPGSKIFNNIYSIKEDAIEYVAIYNRYFVSAIIPKERVRVTKVLFYSDGEKYLAGIVSKFNPDFFKKFEIDYNYILYFGPKLRDEFRAKKDLANLEKTIRFRKIISPIGNLFLDILRLFYKVVKSWGVSIILFTLLMKAVLYPLTHRQFVSMERMQRIQPIIMQVRKQYEKDPKRLNQEIMNIYKKYRVNPLGGCLPLILQIPIFIAIWDMLQYSLELRDASFLWIKSLALPDTVAFILNIPINPLPILMGITMLIQQKFSTTDPQYKLTAMLMPFVFLIIFWNMPSGLLLYWTSQNILNLIEQLYLKAKFAKVDILELSEKK